MTGREQLAWWRSRPAPRRNFVYAIQGNPSSPVKIGTSKDPLKRLRTLQTGSHETLDLLHVLPGWRENEQELHAWFAEWRHRDEWFGGENLGLMLAMLDALAHHLTRDEAAYPADWQMLTSFPPLAAIRSTDEVAAARLQIAFWAKAGAPLNRIASETGWEAGEIRRELRIMDADPAIDVTAPPAGPEHRARTGRSRARHAYQA
jgi:hypothetical protein